MHEASKNISIGLVVTIAVGILVWFLLFLHPSLGDGGMRLHVRFTNIDKIGIGTRVTFAGQPVGEVVAIKMLPEARTTSGQDQADIFAYELVLSIDSHVKIYSSDEISIKTSGLMGEKTIAILPRYAKGAKLLVNNDMMYATASDTVDEAFTNITHMTKKFDKTMDEVNELQDNFLKTLNVIQETSLELKKLLKQANETNLVGSMDNLLNTTQNQVSTIGTKVDRISTNVDDIVTKVAAGQGSLGKMVLSDDFYFKSVAILNKLDIMMNDINNYGVLFHLDKGWQRERRKRMEELVQLRTPQEFKAYLNEEMQKITLASARVNMAIEKANSEIADPIKQKEVIATYADLLNQLQTLEDSLKNISTEILNPQRDVNEAASEVPQDNISEEN